MKLYDIGNPYIRITAYLILMPILVPLLVVIFSATGLFYGIAGFFSGFYFGFSNDNRLMTRKFWIGCWRGIIGD